MRVGLGVGEGALVMLDEERCRRHVAISDGGLQPCPRRGRMSCYANSCFDAEYATEDRNDEGPRMK